ncbi:DUF998 domain-containing protein [Micromonospora mirobrigensis]|uniref:DUF998 domain-containing protein n=1 Tax=Micromonospora mirobrigensis TaxID=262898 RepID=A0A1C4ZF62_9ACTN|nr:DUF998 domain-containing protein [Micromonospora mirobrigensis]SCF31637.1 Protein of unknown function (DUF998) [Micromonospora mirobrigensis]
MHAVPPWALTSAAAAPTLLVGGWTLAAARQPGGFDAVTGTISALAAHGATDRWIMTAALAGLGLCHLVTAAGLRPARPTGRLLLALGGAATLAVAALPLPAGGGSSAPHATAAALAFGALALWPALAGTGRRAPAEAVGLSPRTGTTAAAVLLLLVGWFTAELVGGGDRIGLAERVAAGAEALCPLLVVLLLRRARR